MKLLLRLAISAVLGGGLACSESSPSAETVDDVHGAGGQGGEDDGGLLGGPSMGAADDPDASGEGSSTPPGQDDGGGESGSAEGDANIVPGAEEFPPNVPDATVMSGRCRLSECIDLGVDRPIPLPRPSCPEQEPQEGTECELEGEVCGYGTEANPQCRSFYECGSSRWARADWQTLYECPEDALASCPSKPPEEGEDCIVGSAGAGFACAVGAVACYCVSGTGAPGTSGRWACYGPPSDARCPALAPNVGEGCSTTGVQCEYAINGCLAAPYSTMFCFDGRWEEGERLPCAG